MNGFLEFANNLADGLLWAMVPVTIVATIIGLMSWARRDFGYKSDRPQYGSAELAGIEVLIVGSFAAAFSAKRSIQHGILVLTSNLSVVPRA